MADKETPEKIQSQKRSLETSPTEINITPSQDKNRARIMTPPADKNDIEEIKQLIQLLSKKSDQQFLEINKKLSNLNDDIIATNNEIKSIKARVETLENSKSDGNENLEDLKAEINALKQIEIGSQLSIHNIPKNIEAESAVECFSKWAKIELNKSVLKRASVASKKEKNTNVLYLDFFNASNKYHFMKFIRSAQRNEQKKYIPILTDNIFELDANDISRGLELNFREAMTEMNREIFNAAKKEKNVFTNVWINQGYVTVRLNKDTVIKIKSIEHLNLLIQQNNHK